MPRLTDLASHARCLPRLTDESPALCNAFHAARRVACHAVRSHPASRSAHGRVLQPDFFVIRGSAVDRSLREPWVLRRLHVREFQFARCYGHPSERVKI